jgi:hypothetical protein
MEEGPIADQPNAGNTYNGFTPIALVNRFDTVTAGSLNCGQHRVVFALPPAVAAATGDVNRFLMIFEAVLPNPDPTGNPASCLAVTQFWDDLSSPLLTDANRVAMLESFYFDGITGKDAEGKDLNFQPVVMAQHYGINSQNDSTDTGQIRVNMLEPTTFPQLTDWDLREFRLSQTCTAEGDAGLKCTVTANNTVVQNNPAAALFAATGAQLSSFQTAFLGQLPSLAATSVAGISWEIPQADDSIDSIELWANIAVFFRNNDYTLQALSPQFSSAISKALVPINTKLGLTGANALTVTDMVNRAETQSCAGCHEVVQANGSAEAVLGGGLPNWPSSNGFTQISELGPNADTGTFGVPTLSPALTGTFLPARGQNLVTFLQDNGGI